MSPHSFDFLLINPPPKRVTIDVRPCGVMVKLLHCQGFAPGPKGSPDVFLLFRTGLRKWFSASKHFPIRHKSPRLTVETLELRDCPSAILTSDKSAYAPGAMATFH